MKKLVEQCRKININELVRSIKSELVNLNLKSRLEALGQNIDVTTTPCYFGGKRFWFICPNCKKKVGVLYQTPISDQLKCRKCHNLIYLKSRYHKML